jgi:hypothetical protein
LIVAWLLLAARHFFWRKRQSDSATIGVDAVLHEQAGTGQGSCASTNQRRIKCAGSFDSCIMYNLNQSGTRPGCYWKA